MAVAMNGPLTTARRRGGRVVECTALEMRHTCKGIVGSNPTLSAINNLGYQALLVIFRLFKSVNAAAQIGEGRIYGALLVCECQNVLV